MENMIQNDLVFSKHHFFRLLHFGSKSKRGIILKLTIYRIQIGTKLHVTILRLNPHFAVVDNIYRLPEGHVYCPSLTGHKRPEKRDWPQRSAGRETAPRTSSTASARRHMTSPQHSSAASYLCGLLHSRLETDS